MSESTASRIHLVRKLLEEPKKREFNLSLYFDKYSPVALFPELFAECVQDPSRECGSTFLSGGGLRRLSLCLLGESVIPRAMAKSSGKERVEFFDKVLKGKARDVSTPFQVRLSDGELQFYESFFDMWEEFIDSAASPGAVHVFKTTSRLAVGFGDESIYETNVRLMRNYGVPYIPGSALKGAAEHWAFYMIAETLQRNSEKYGGDFYALAGRVQKALEGRDEDFYEELTSLEWELVLEGLSGSLRLALGEALELFKEVFGTTNQEGTVIFFDALPLPESIEEKPILELDIMNTHYPGYYQGNEPPGDWQEPKPIFFLTVPSGIEFKIAAGLRAGDADHVKLASALLAGALSELGVGAKTALGYGRLEPVSDGGGRNRG